MSPPQRTTRSSRGNGSAKAKSPRRKTKLNGAGTTNSASSTGSSAQAPKQGSDRFEAVRTIRVRGAREHNLKNVDVDIPRDRLVVITGLSGSGKSSLAFDTVFAEGQRKYMESLSAYARQFMGQLEKPDVDDIEGLPPTIAIEQRSSTRSPRSTVATSTEIYDYLRLLFARAGQPTCWEPINVDTKGRVTERCGQKIVASHPARIVESVVSLPEGTKLMVLAPVVRAKKGYHRDALERLHADGFVRARVDGEIIDLGDALSTSARNPLRLGRYELHSIEAVVDRITVRPKVRQRLSDSVEVALRTGEGSLIIAQQEPTGAWTETVYSERHACPEHPSRALTELEPRLFSFNSPHGACPTCHGLGTLHEYDPELVLPDPDKALDKGGIAPWAKNGPAAMFAGRFIRRFCRKLGISPNTKVGALTSPQRQALLYGSSAVPEAGFTFAWDGVIPMLHGWFERTESNAVKDYLQKFIANTECGTCFGDRLRIESLAVFLELSDELPAPALARRARHGLSQDARLMNIADFTQLSVEDALRVIGTLKLNREQETIAAPIIREVSNRLRFLASVGLEYLSLDRRTSSLSGGEAQRIRLATQVGSGIVGAAYVLDEPTIGLHPRDNDRLIRTLRHLSDIGNSVLVVEHDEEMIRAADQVIDVGPGPGVHGGTIVAQGTIAEIEAAQDSATGDYLAKRKSVPTPTAEERRPLKRKTAITVVGATEHNLKNITVEFPLGGLVCVTGVSGSGKSTLVNDILLRAIRKHLYQSRDETGAHKRIGGLSRVAKIVEVDQSPIGRTPRSNPATYSGMFDEIRKLLSQTPEARARGYGPGRFSFNVKGGRCEACQGQGQKRVTMHFLPDVFVNCETCGGSRYNQETLQVRYRGKNIADILNLTIDDACSFFSSIPRIRRVAECLVDVGLGYVTLGQRSTTLSGGEAQRVKIAAELWRTAGGKTASSIATRKTATKKTAAPQPQQHAVFILDEPTTGLHFADVHRLIDVLQRLVDGGNSVVVIEHNLDVIKSADWVIDLGPEGGAQGGNIVAEGTPEDLSRVKASYTGQYLAKILGPSRKRPQKTAAATRTRAKSRS